MVGIRFGLRNEMRLRLPVEFPVAVEFADVVEAARDGERGGSTDDSGWWSLSAGCRAGSVDVDEGLLAWVAVSASAASSIPSRKPISPRFFGKGPAWGRGGSSEGPLTAVVLVVDSGGAVTDTVGVDDDVSSVSASGDTEAAAAALLMEDSETVDAMACDLETSGYYACVWRCRHSGIKDLEKREGGELKRREGGEQEERNAGLRLSGGEHHSAPG